MAAPSMDTLNAVLQRHNISIADANDLVLLQGYDIVFIADDSGSMQLSSVPQNQRKLGQSEPSRWDELKGTVQMIVEIATCFDPDGVDIFFLNRPSIHGIRSRDDPALAQAFASPPFGGTPLTEMLQSVLQKCSANTERPVLVMIATDGEPNGGPHRFMQVIRDAIARRTTQTKFKFQILACTDDDDAVGWLNKFDQEFAEVDVTDDYHSEKQEVLRAEKCRQFQRGDWVIKALLGPISSKFDGWDEKPAANPHAPAYNPYRASQPPQQRNQQKQKQDECCQVL